MSKHDKLQKIKPYDYPNCRYADIKEFHMQSFEQFLEAKCTIRQCVNGHYYHGYDTSMDENGMDKFIAMLAGMLFMISHDDVEVDQAYGTNWDIKDFETGEYDDLFEAEDLVHIRNDIQIIKSYLALHPELLKD